MLEAVGLKAPEEDAYRLLLGRGDLGAPDLAALQGTSVPSAHARLERLVAAGLASASADQPPVFHAVDPRAGLSSLIRSRQAELEQASAAVEMYAAEYRERMLRSEAFRLVEVVEGRAAISQQFADLMAGAEEEVLAFDTPPYVSGTLASSALEREVLARGVAVRAVYASEVIAAEDRAESAAELTRLGELFEATWARGTPIFATAAGAAGELDQVDRALLSLLNAGLKDEAVGRQLDLSERTVRRRIADLVDRLGATSRFQAGAQAVRRGWLA